MLTKKFILITRPIEEARVFARTLQQDGYHVMIEPMFDIVRTDYKVPDVKPYQALVFTSVSGVRMVKGTKLLTSDLPVLCVGDRTAREAKAQGFTKAASAKGRAHDLVGLADDRLKDKSKPLLYVRGEQVAQPLDKMLKDIGFDVDTVVAYTTVPVKALTPRCIAALKAGRIEAITFFSKRTMETFLREVKKNGLMKEFFDIKLLSISDSVLECVRPYRQARTYSAASPDGPAMMSLVRKTCRKKRRIL